MQRLCSPELEIWIREQTKGARCVVDFGAGLFDKLEYVPKMAKKIGIEIFLAYAGFARPGINVACIDMRDWESRIAPKDRDVAMLIDTLEHIPKEDGEKLLSELKEAFRKVIVFTPLGFHEQVNDETGYGNKFQQHECGWMPAELEAFGFEVREDPLFHGERGGAIFASTVRR